MRYYINAVNDQLFEENENIKYSTSPTEQQLEQAASLINNGGQLVISLNGNKLDDGTILVVVALDGDKVVGTASIKKGNEIGYLMVDPSYRRYGIARQLTDIRINYAKSHNIPLIYSSIRKDNVASINNIKSMGFTHAGDKKSPYSSNILSYFYLPINASEEYAKHFIQDKFGL